MKIIEKIKEKCKEIFSSKLGKKVALGTTVATLGLATACGTDKEAQIVDNSVKIEQDKDFREQYKYDIETKNEEKTVEQKVNELETKEDVSDFLKNMYIEQLETITGNTDYTTEDIEFEKKYLDTVYVNKKTGEMIPYGSNYKQVEQKLKEEGISYEIEEDVEVYEVTDTEGKVIDCVTLQSKDGETVPVKVMMVEQFGKPYTSVLTTMKTAIPAGVEYIGYLKKGNENDIAVSKRDFIKSVEKFENEKVEQKAVENEIKALKTPKEVLQYLKNMYIEVYEKMTGDTDLTTTDIELDAYLTDLYRYEFKPNQEHLFSTAEHNVKVYQVKNTKKNVIDCVSLESEDGETVPVEVNMDRSIDNSVLATMGTVIPDGLKYVEDMEKGNESDIIVSKKRFIEAVKKFENAKQNQNATEEKTGENPEEGLEHE